MNETFPRKCALCLISGKETIWHSKRERIQHNLEEHQIKRGDLKAGCRGGNNPNFRKYAVKQ